MCAPFNRAGSVGDITQAPAEATRSLLGRCLTRVAKNNTGSDLPLKGEDAAGNRADFQFLADSKANLGFSVHLVAGLSTAIPFRRFPLPAGH
jgi:hypothetical protein